jgi:uncharacterized protein involved in propanediol utilization
MLAVAGKEIALASSAPVGLASSVPDLAAAFATLLGHLRTALRVFTQEQAQGRALELGVLAQEFGY